MGECSFDRGMFRKAPTIIGTSNIITVLKTYKRLQQCFTVTINISTPIMFEIGRNGQQMILLQNVLYDFFLPPCLNPYLQMHRDRTDMFISPASRIPRISPSRLPGRRLDCGQVVNVHMPMDLSMLRRRIRQRQAILDNLGRGLAERGIRGEEQYHYTGERARRTGGRWGWAELIVWSWV